MEIQSQALLGRSFKTQHCCISAYRCLIYRGSVALHEWFIIVPDTISLHQCTFSSLLTRVLNVGNVSRMKPALCLWL